MSRKYGSDQREYLNKMKKDLIYKIEELYRNEFQNLNNKEIGAGAINSLAQLYLISRDAALTPLLDSLENNK
tara:strand:+ start:100 stop:315 length:216 start_codon:yes stop_codon:yes gene_type:complete